MFFSVSLGFVLEKNLSSRTEFVTYDAQSIELLHCVSAFFLQLVGVEKCKVHPCTGTEALYSQYGP